MKPYNTPQPVAVSFASIRDSPEATAARCVAALAAGNHITLIQEPPGLHYMPALDNMGTITAYRTDATGLAFWFTPHPLAAAFGEKSRWIRLNSPQQKAATP